MTWVLVALLVGYGFGRYGFGWVADAYRWCKARVSKSDA